MVAKTARAGDSSRSGTSRRETATGPTASAAMAASGTGEFGSRWARECANEQKQLPEALRDFVEPTTDHRGREGRPERRIGSRRTAATGTAPSPASSCRGVSRPRDDDPNMTDVNRVGKEANFNQYLTERVGTFLVASDVIRFDRQNRYEAGPNLAAFWDHDEAKLPAITRQAVVRSSGTRPAIRSGIPRPPRIGA